MPKRRTIDRPRRRRVRRKDAVTGTAVGPKSIAEPSLDGKDLGSDKDETEVREIIRQIQQGRTHLFKMLIDRYRAQVAGIAYKMVGDYDDAKDISQMVFVKTFYNIQRFDLTKRFSTWLYRIAVNASIDYIRKFKKHKFEELEDVNEPGSSSVTPEQAFQLKELREFVLQAAQRLNEKQHTAFVLKDLEGKDIDEIAEIMGMPQATVRWYLHRARKKLRSDLRRRFGPILSKMGIGEGG
ncbi:MAG: sigma-70 family RNA polymerase sigma factor [Candidatus Zixiibacteriota bacterium]